MRAIIASLLNFAFSPTTFSPLLLALLQYSAHALFGGLVRCSTLLSQARPTSAELGLACETSSTHGYYFARLQYVHTHIEAGLAKACLSVLEVTHFHY